MNLGSNLYNARKKSGLSQEEVAKKLGVSRQTINAVEAGRFVPSTVLALKIARCFGKSVETVFQLEESD